MKKINKGQIITIHAILAKMGLDKEYKQGLVQTYSDGRETSTTQLTFSEAVRLIEDLQKQVGWTPEQVLADQKRKRIFAVAHKLGLELPDGRVDIERVDRFCIEKGHLHKPLMDYSAAELSKLIYQFDQWYKDHLKRI